MANRFATARTRLALPVASKREAAACPSRISPIWSAVRATIATVGGDMFDHLSPGTPTIDPG